MRVFFRGAAHEIVANNGGYEVVFNLPLLEKGNVDLSKKVRSSWSRSEATSETYSYQIRWYA